MTSAGQAISAISSSGVTMASTQRCRGAGNIAEYDSWNPGCVLARNRTSASSSLTRLLS